MKEWISSLFSKISPPSPERVTIKDLEYYTHLHSTFHLPPSRGDMDKWKLEGKGD